MDKDEDDAGPSRRIPTENGRRRSTRTSALTQPSRSGVVDDWSYWRGERRSTRLGASTDTQLEGPPTKRSRTVESATSSTDGAVPPPVAKNGIKFKANGAAAVKPTETVVETVAGKKKSKFWVYAVEPIAPQQGETHAPSSADVDMPDVTSSAQFNGYRDKTAASSVTDDADHASLVDTEGNGDIYEKSAAGSLSSSSMDDS
jgi:hypothetical protein